MYLAQTGDIGPIIKALNDAGVTGYLLVFVIALIVGGGLVFMALRIRGKKDDGELTVTKSLVALSGTLVSNITKLTDSQLEMQTGSRERDRQMNLIIKSTEEQNERLGGIKDELASGNSFTKTLYKAIGDSTSDTATVLGEFGKTFKSSMDKTTASLEAKLDLLPDRVAGKFLESHSNLKQTIIERTKSIEDLFIKITNENEDLTAKVELRDDTIVSLQSQLSKAQAELAALKPDPTDPPPSPDHKAAIPLDSADSPDLTQTERAA